MSRVEVIRGPEIAWRRGEETGILIGFRLCEESTRRVRLTWRLTSTSGDQVQGQGEPLSPDEGSCVITTAVVPPQDLTALWTLWDDEANRPLWQATSYLSVAGYEPTLVPDPGQRLGPSEPSGGKAPLPPSGSAPLSL